jgi:ABC-2 type transport system ATP-binding protein
LIQLLSVSKVFFDIWGRVRVRAVENLSLDVERGEVLGLLGPNGAGKSTAIKLLLGLLRPTSGRLSVFGRDPRDQDVRRRVGYLPEETRLHKFLTASETIDFFGSLLGLARAERRKRTGALLEMVGLERARDRKVGEMSKGMARRIGLAVALVGDPELLVLDEPTSGLDPIGTREVKDLVIELGKRGKTILLSSHLLADVEDACHRIAILYGGELRAVGKTAELLARDERIRIELDRPPVEALRALEAAAQAAAGGKPVTIGSPADRLEAFFLRVIGVAQKAGVETGGARKGGEVASFLKGASPTVIEALVAATPPAPPTPAPIPPTPAPVPPTPALPPAGGGGQAPSVERVVPLAPVPAASTENAKTKAVLDRLLAPRPTEKT